MIVFVRMQLQGYLLEVSLSFALITHGFQTLHDDLLRSAIELVDKEGLGEVSGGWFGAHGRAEVLFSFLSGLLIN